MNTITLDTALGPFIVPETGTVTRALQAGQWWDAHLKPILDEASVGWALDIGAHIGWFSRYLAERHAVVIALEPHPETFQLLLQNTRSPHPETASLVQCWPLAAHNHPAVLQWDARNHPTDAGGWAYTAEEASDGVSVLAAPLDRYLPDDAPIAVIKCDAQGADLPTLQGLTQTITRCRPLIVFEWEAEMALWQGDCWDDYLAFFDALDYTVERITTSYWDYVARPR